MNRHLKNALQGIAGGVMAIAVGVLFVLLAMWTWFFTDWSFEIFRH